MSMSLQGILPALVTPLNADNSVDVRSFEQLLQHVYSAGVDGVYICGSTGEGLLLPADARRIVAETAVKSSPAGRQVIVHIGASSIEETLALAKHATSLGVAAISSLPLAGIDPKGLRAFYQQIADAADVPLVAYYFPKLTGFELNFNQLQEIAEISAVQGIKFTDFDLFTLSLLANEGITVFNGRDEVLAAGLLMGASAASTIFCPNSLPSYSRSPVAVIGMKRAHCRVRLTGSSRCCSNTLSFLPSSSRLLGVASLAVIHLTQRASSRQSNKKHCVLS